MRTSHHDRPEYTNSTRASPVMKTAAYVGSVPPDVSCHMTKTMSLLGKEKPTESRKKATTFQKPTIASMMLSAASALVATAFALAVTARNTIVCRSLV